MGTHVARRLTAAVLAALGEGASAYDSSLPGFLARKRKSGRVDYFVRRRGRYGIHRVIGNDSLISLSDAREVARKVLAEHVIARNSEPGKRFTIDSAWPLYRASLLAKGERRSPLTIRAYEMNLRRLSPDFRRLPLRVLSEDPELFAAEFDRIASDRRSAAQATGRTIRSIYGYIKLRHDTSLPARSPTIDREIFAGKAADHRVVREGDYREWWKRVALLPDPIRREAHLLLALSGMRPAALVAMRLEHQDRDDPTLWLIPKPKGGTAKAFTLVLSEPMRACVRRVLAIAGATGRANGFLFPATRGNGALTRIDADAKVTWAPPRALRRGFATVGESIGVPERTIGRLLNHASGAPITSLYIRSDPGGQMLRQHQEAISARIVAAIGDPALAAEPDDATAEQIAAWEADAQPWAQ